MFWKKTPQAPPKEAPFFPWTPDLRLGIRQFDLEHQQMGSLISQLHGLMTVRRDRVAASELVEVLIQATRSHFAGEEALLRESGYPDCEAHFAEHSQLIDELRNLHRQFQAGTLSTLALPLFLKKWLMEHIQHTDRLYVSHLKAHGIK